MAAEANLPMETPKVGVTHVSKLGGIRQSEVNFVICQTAALVYSYIFRWCLHPRKVSPTTRHVAQIGLGVLMAWVSFGWGILHVLVGAGVSYLMILTLNPKVVQYYVFVYSMLHLSWVHLYMQVRNAGVGNLDYIGPMMILTVKTSALAFSIHDGLTKDDTKLNSLQRELVVRRYPGFLEYWSYIFCPQGLLLGPVCYFSSYIDFIEGKNFSRKVKDENGEEKIVYEEPSSARAVTTKLLFALFCGIVLLTLMPIVPIMRNVSDDILNSPFLYRLGYLLISVEVAKSKYFFGWVWAEAIGNAAGLGFTGYDKNGRPMWSGLQNLDIIGFQTATSLKAIIASWNIRCSMWLKFVCYDRVPTHKQLLTFILSALWHGFYPGYFATFLTASLVVSAASKVRYVVRPYFQSSLQLRRLYDVITWACTYLALAYIITPFTYLRLEPTLKFFNWYYWFLHILAVLVLCTFPSRQTHDRHKANEKTNHSGFRTSQNGSCPGDNGATSIREVVYETQTMQGRKER